jgi:hypothetical protein
MKLPSNASFNRNREIKASIIEIEIKRSSEAARIRLPGFMWRWCLPRICLYGNWLPLSKTPTTCPQDCKTLYSGAETIAPPSGTKDGKLLWLIPIEVSIQTQVAAQTLAITKLATVVELLVG